MVDRAWFVLAVIVLASTVGRFALSRGVAAPWIASDEQLYGLLGRSLVSGDGLTVLGHSVPYYSLLYPFLVGLPFLWGDAAGAVTWVQAVQALLMSATAVPVFVWARPLAGRRYALVAAGLSALIPGLVYSGLLMSEALYYTVATLAVWALALALVKPTISRQALLLGAVGLAVLTRLQAVGFAAVIVADTRVDGVAKHLPDVGSGGEGQSAVGGNGIAVDVVGVREVKHRTPRCSDRSRRCAVGGHDFAGLGVAHPVTELMAPQVLDCLLR